ncbi:fungal-specific transcription factor domain-containing protein [Penicillium sp. IBT 18751x]|nr:fungal-specific transcription factor domain-containing protein [Penicillium sp. IBT 18751x]
MVQSLVGDSDSSSPSLGGSKRKRMIHACESCRRRKSRCNGTRPACYQSRTASLADGEAQATTRSSSPAKSRPCRIKIEIEEQAALEERVNKLERVLQNIMSKSNADSGTRQIRSPPSSLTVASTAESSDPIDGMGCMIFSSEEAVGYFGPTSNAAFLDHVVKAYKHLQQERVPGGASENMEIKSGAESPPPVTQPALPIDCPLPQFKESSWPVPSGEKSRLLETFFADIGDMFPYLDKKTILSYISKVESGHAEKLQSIQVCLVNMCMAFASLQEGPISSENRHTVNPDVYFQRARRVLPDILSQKASLESSESDHAV